MPRIIALLWVFITMSACGPGESPEERERREFIFEGKWRLEQSARNPDRFETRNEHIATGMYGGQRVVCLEYNGENGFGGMSGWKRAMMVGAVVPMTESYGKEQEFFEAAWREAGC